MMHKEQTEQSINEIADIVKSRGLPFSAKMSLFFGKAKEFTSGNEFKAAMIVPAIVGVVSSVICAASASEMANKGINANLAYDNAVMLSAASLALIGGAFLASPIAALSERIARNCAKKEYAVSAEKLISSFDECLHSIKNQIDSNALTYYAQTIKSNVLHAYVGQYKNSDGSLPESVSLVLNEMDSCMSKSSFAAWRSSFGKEMKICTDKNHDLCNEKITPLIVPRHL